MTDILFFSDYKKSHLIPTFNIAKNLKDHGYRVGYVGVQSVLSEATRMGFDTYNLVVENNTNSISAILSGSMDQTMEILKPKVIIATPHNPLENISLVL